MIMETLTERENRIAAQEGGCTTQSQRDRLSSLHFHGRNLISKSFDADGNMTATFGGCGTMWKPAANEHLTVVFDQMGNVVSTG